MSSLEPPRKSVELVDPGAHELDPSVVDNSQPKVDTEMEDASEVPTLRVERSDGEPAYGEVPGTAAYEKRQQDAEPDEMEVISDSNEQSAAVAGKGQKALPGGLSIPKTVVEKVDPESPSYGEEPGTAAFDMRKADATPDVVLTAPEITRTDLEGIPTSPINRYPDVEQYVETSRMENQNLSKYQNAWEEGSNGSAELSEKPESEAELDYDEQQTTDLANDTNASLGGVSLQDVADGDDDDFGEDFDDFEEGAANDDDFGEFDEPAVNPESLTPAPTIALPVLQSPQPVQLPNINFASLHSLQDIAAACQPYLDGMLPDLGTVQSADQTSLPDINTSFLTERSQSLWAQLVAPPPLQPPDWIRSRIRRLFLVSLGVPVDLDEILPASKQKKLVLPSMHVEGDRSPRIGAGIPINGGALDKAKIENNVTMPAESPGQKLERKRTGPLPPPELDLYSARHLCSTTDVALRNLSSDEMQNHIGQLEDLTQRASEVLEYWKAQKDSAVGNQKAFEAVIENLVKHAQKIRK